MLVGLPGTSNLRTNKTHAPLPSLEPLQPTVSGTFGSFRKVFDNRRILHARSHILPSDGERWVQGGYMGNLVFFSPSFEGSCPLELCIKIRRIIVDMILKINQLPNCLFAYYTKVFYIFFVDDRSDFVSKSNISGNHRKRYCFLCEFASTWNHMFKYP